MNCNYMNNIAVKILFFDILNTTIVIYVIVLVLRCVQGGGVICAGDSNSHRSHGVGAACVCIRGLSASAT